MKIIITMAGEGSRFKKIGIKKSKYEIVARDKTLFEWSMLSLSDFFSEEFIFIVKKSDNSEEFIKEKCTSLGIEKYEVIGIDKLTEGQASTVMEAKKSINEEDDIVIYNIDTYIKEYIIKKKDILDDYSGFIPVFKTNGESKWSFTKLDEEKNVIEITEKIPISDYGTIGLYYFKYFSDFEKIYKENKQEIIKKYFADYYLYNSDITFDFTDKNNKIVHANVAEPWKVTLVDTGLNTMTGGRILRAKEHLKDEPFMLTYGDGVADVDIDALLKFHKNHGKTATITTVSLAQQKGVLQKEESGLITSFREKSEDDSAIINGGFMVLNPNIFDYITEGDATIFEQKPMLQLAKDGELMGFEHDGFWQCMDTQREKEKLENLWASGKAPWMRWTE